MTNPTISTQQAAACGALVVGVVSAAGGVGLVVVDASRRGLKKSVSAGVPGHHGGAANIPFAAAF
jgi:hypothetical protein